MDAGYFISRREYGEVVRGLRAHSSNDCATAAPREVSGSDTLNPVETLGDVAQLVRALPCHGRGRGFEPRRPRHTFQRSYSELAETTEGAEGHKFVSLLCPF